MKKRSYIYTTVVCQKCGKLFNVADYRVPTAKYCSRECCYPRKKPKHPMERFFYTINPHTGCWIWSGYIGPDGYGMASSKINKRGNVRAHIISYEHFNGPVPVGGHIDHLCRNKACVNPNHLEAVTPKENARRWSASRTHCLNGHALDGNNLRVNAKGHKECRACGRLKYYRDRDRKAALLAEKTEP